MTDALPLAAPVKHPSRGPSLETFGMTKTFGRFTALDDVSIKVPAGTFHALLGENGAGKSTLVKCIMGFYSPDKGQLLLDDQEVAVANPRDAQALGIGMVYQHFTLVPSLDGRRESGGFAAPTRRASSTGARSARRSKSSSTACRSKSRSTGRCPRSPPARSRSSRS